jgi:hypothetical protein
MEPRQPYQDPEQPHINPGQPIQSAISDLQKGHSSPVSRFFDTLKTKYPNLHTLYVLTNIINIWSGVILIGDSWAHKVNLIAEPTTPFSLEVGLRHLSFLIAGIILLLLDDLSLKELLFGRKTPSEKDIRDMNFREKFFHNFKTKYPNLSTIYTLMAIVFCWTGIWGLVWDIPIQPFWRSIMTVCVGFFMLYIDDMSLDEI